MRRFLETFEHREQLCIDSIRAMDRRGRQTICSAPYRAGPITVALCRLIFPLANRSFSFFFLIILKIYVLFTISYKERSLFSNCDSSIPLLAAAIENFSRKGESIGRKECQSSCNNFKANL